MADMLMIFGWNVAAMLLTCGWHVGDMWLTCGCHAADMWLTCGWHAADMWLTCGWYEAGIWLMNGIVLFNFIIWPEWVKNWLEMLLPLNILESHSKQVANMHQGYFVVQLGLNQNLCNYQNIICLWSTQGSDISPHLHGHTQVSCDFSYLLEEVSDKYSTQLIPNNCHIKAIPSKVLILRLFCSIKFVSHWTWQSIKN